MNKDITYHFEPWASFWREAESIIYTEHQPETNQQDEYSGPFDCDMYEVLDRSGKLEILVARKGAEIVGYHVAIVMPAPHGTETLCGMVSFYFVRPKYRKLGVGSQMFLRAAAHLFERGVTRIFTSTRCHLSHANHLRRLGWEDYELTLVRKASWH